MRKQVAVVAGLCLALSLGACGGSGGKKSEAPKGEAQEQVADTGEEPADQPAEEAQVFETDQARVEYRETIDSTGNALVLFSFENKTDRAVMVNGEGVVVNGEYQITPLGGSDISGIQPGMTGQVSIVFGVDVQTSLSGVSDLETISADLVMRDADNLTEEVGRVHVDVTV